MNNEDKMFELMEKMYGEFSNFRKEVKDRFDTLENEVSGIKKVVIKIEDEHGKKLQALFDGYKQNADRLDRIEKEVGKHEEFILKRVK